MAQPSIDAPPAPRNDEDYTDAVCLLTRRTEKYPDYAQVLIDVEDFERVCRYEWLFVKVGKKRTKRVANTNMLYLHTLIMSTPPGKSVDHIRHDALDNRKARMRVGTVRENNLNTRGNPSASSRFKGVSWEARRKKWKVITGTRAGGKVYLGSFDDEREAAMAYNDYVREHFGPCAYLNPV